MSDTVKKNLGGVTAYVYARGKGYTGTEDEFAQLMANYATVGQAAEEAAEQAIAAEINAESAAQTATTKASEASSSATSASSSASAAATSETNAAASATAASGSATQSAASATAAQTAQTAAEAVLESIPEDYTELSDDVSELKNALSAEYIESMCSYSAVSATGSDGILLADNAVMIGTGYKASITVSEKDVYQISGRQFNDTTAPAYLFRNNGSIVYAGWIDAGYFSDYVVAIPEGVDELVVNLNSSLGVATAAKKAEKITTAQLSNLVDNAITTDMLGNILTFTWIAGGWINYSNGAVVSSESYYYTDYIPVFNHQSIRTYTNIAGNAGFAFYDITKKYLSGYQAVTSGLMERVNTVPDNAAYVRLTCHLGSVSVEGTNTLRYYGESPQLNQASEDIRNIKDITGNGNYTRLPVDIEPGLYNNGGEIISDSGLHILIQVNPGENYEISGHQLSNWFPLGQLYNDGVRVSGIDAGATGAIKNFKVLIPEGVNQLIVNGISFNNLSVKKLVSPFYASQLYDWYVVPATPLDDSIDTDGATVQLGHHLAVDVIPGEHYKISGARWSDSVPSWLVSNGSSIIAYETGATSQYFTDLEITIPEGGQILYVNGNAITGLRCIRYGQIEYERKHKTLAGKTMVWFGTSIPQNQTYFEGNNWSIPSYAGKILGMNVINECYGASIAARGIYNKITENDPYGWTGVSWYAVFRALGANLTEKQDLIDNYTSKWYALLGGPDDPLYPNAKPQTLTDALKAEILSCSYENRLVPYLNGTKQMPDLFVFEHGYNDSQATVFSGISPDETNLNRSRYSDAMYFFFKLIWEANPQAKIMVVSHYDNSSEVGKKTFTAQKELAEYHGVYFCDVANNVGWTQRLVTTTGYWDNGNWIASGGTERTITRLAMCIPDQVHPHTDKSGNAVKREAQVVADYIASSVNLD